MCSLNTLLIEALSKNIGRETVCFCGQLDKKVETKNCLIEGSPLSLPQTLMSVRQTQITVFPKQLVQTQMALSSALARQAIKEME